ncbi:MAG: hypothetical protein OXR66_04240 [Candidatus Woesearchaeota archaeon]|nr:hypothetical protein [Candidatus Woesearchaeota archaeon]
MAKIDKGKRYVIATLDGCFDGQTGQEVEEKVFAAMLRELPQYYNEETYPLRFYNYNSILWPTTAEEHPSLEGYEDFSWGIDFCKPKSISEKDSMYLHVHMKEPHELVIYGDLFLKCPSLFHTKNHHRNGYMTGRVANLLVFGPRAVRRNYTLSGSANSHDGDTHHKLIMFVEDPTIENMNRTMEEGRTLVQFMETHREPLQQLAREIEPTLQTLKPIRNACKHIFRGYRELSRQVKQFGIDMPEPKYDSRIISFIDGKMQHALDNADLPTPPKGLSHCLPLLSYKF